jgi:VIT1/CCC1 family predicted Fe2+/Mn2+ transporter
MTSMHRHSERHRTDRIGWLRAAVLGANDGIVSTSSLILGVAAAGTGHAGILVSGIAALVAGAMSMAAGEYVSVHSQADTENADLVREQAELDKDPAAERRELAAIYVTRGLEVELAQQVAEQLMAHDAIGAHARDELGISEAVSARPVQAALASAASFAAGATLPLAVTALAQKWLSKIGLADKWRTCSHGRSNCPERGAADEKAQKEPHSSIQGESRRCRIEG